jgi:hypothetical protein
MTTTNNSNKRIRQDSNSKILTKKPKMTQRSEIVFTGSIDGVWLMSKQAKKQCYADLQEEIESMIGSLHPDFDFIPPDPK